MSKSKLEFLQNSPLHFFGSIEKKASKIDTLDKEILQTINSPYSAGQLPPGIFFNENHDDIFPKKFLTSNAQYLKEIGIETLFIEFWNNEIQNELDEYNLSSQETSFPWSYENKKIGPLYTEIWTAIHKAGIRLVAINSPATCPSPTLNNYYWARNREELFNNFSANVIQKEHRGKPYIVYTGLAHGHTSKKHDTYHVPSISGFLGITNTYSVFLKDNLTDDYANKYKVDIIVCANDFKSQVSLNIKEWEFNRYVDRFLQNYDERDEDNQLKEFKRTLKP